MQTVIMHAIIQVIAGIMDGQSYIGGLTGSQKKNLGNGLNPGVNTWRCAMGGKKFQPQNLYQDDI